MQCDRTLYDETSQNPVSSVEAQFRLKIEGFAEKKSFPFSRDTPFWREHFAEELFARFSARKIQKEHNWILEANPCQILLCYQTIGFF